MTTSSEDLDETPADTRPYVRLERRRPQTNLEQPAVVQGGKPGQRFLRLPRSSERYFTPEAEGGLVATERSIAPRSGLGRAMRSLRRVMLGAPLSTEATEEQRLPKGKALAVFSSDALSSSAYATDEILIVLLAAGAGALTHSLAIAVSIAALLVIVSISYRQTIRAYPNGGGAYIVARENLGNGPGLVAAASLSVDYVLTVSVSIAAGVLAITSALPELQPYRVELAVGAIVLITLANLRGIRESGTIFAIPTYGFIASFGLLIAVGLVRVVLDPDLRAPIPEHALEPGLSALSAFLVLRAFASGCTALTGIEAISNGIPSFTRPEAKNAATTLAWMAAILVTFFLSMTLLANLLEVRPSEEMSIPAQISRTIFGESVIFYIIQASTALILILAANTAYADFPRLASILARDRFLPHQFTFRGDRLAFSNGIIVLGIAASVLVVIYDANVTHLIPLYAFGVFVSFTLSQSGMLRHWWRERGPGWKRSIAINALGASATLVVAAIVGSTKFTHGAWISMVIMAILAVLFWTISAHFARVERRLALHGVALGSGTRRRRLVVVPVAELNLATLKTLDYARSLSDTVEAVYITDDHAEGRGFRETWDATVPDVPLVIIDSPYRAFVGPFLSYLDAQSTSSAGGFITVVVPELRTAFPWEHWLHNQSVRRLRTALEQRSDIVTAEVPYDLAR